MAYGMSKARGPLMTLYVTIVELGWGSNVHEVRSQWQCEPKVVHELWSMVEGWPMATMEGVDLYLEWDSMTMSHP
jgi:hypothetical protein